MQTFLRKYGVQTTIHFVLYEVDGVDLRVDAADGGTDCSMMKDEGAEATCDNDFADEGKGYSLVLTATEMEAAEIMVYIVDSATKLWLDEALKIETYGHASAMHAMDLDDAIRGGMTALPAAAADASGGMLISDAGGRDVDTILGRITGNVALASICLDARLAELSAPNLPADIDTLVGICTDGRLAELSGVNLPADIANLNDLSAPDINAEMLDVLKTDTSTLPGQEAPTATPTLEKALMYLYKALRNKSDENATQAQLYADNGSTVDQKWSVADDGTTFTKGEIGSGA